MDGKGNQIAGNLRNTKPSGNKVRVDLEKNSIHHCVEGALILIDVKNVGIEYPHSLFLKGNIDREEK